MANIMWSEAHCGHDGLSQPAAVARQEEGPLGHHPVAGVQRQPGREGCGDEHIHLHPGEAVPLLQRMGDQEERGESLLIGLHGLRSLL